MADEKTYTADDYRRMLINLIDAHYGAAFHHIGDGDGLLEQEAKEISDFWEWHLDKNVKKFANNVRDRQR